MKKNFKEDRKLLAKSVEGKIYEKYQQRLQLHMKNKYKVDDTDEEDAVLQADQGNYKML